MCFFRREAALMALTLCAALSWGCTDANPSYQGGDNGVGRDGSVDRPITRDDAGDGPVGDSTVDQLQPDVVPAVCGTDKDCDDGRDCTDDRCDV